VRRPPTLVAHVALICGALVCGALACHSPEARRARGDGHGADVGNRAPVVRMHEGSRMYYETPCLLPNRKCAGPLPVSGLPGDFPDATRRRS
jgi:hypothetical protein